MNAMRSKARQRLCVALGGCLLVLAGPVLAQTLNWGEFAQAPGFGGGSTQTTQTHIASIPGGGRGSGAALLTLSVVGGTAAWNGFGVGRNDDGYYPGPNQPLPGITFTNGGPGYGGGIPDLAVVSFANGYNLAGAPVNTPTPPSDRDALYFDAGDGTTTTATWDFTGLIGGSLPAGSWLFLDSVDQGERIILNGPSGWIANVHAGDSTLPRPAAPFPVPTLVQNPTFPTCTPGLTQTATTLQLDGRYGDISTAVPTCSNVPVPVPGQTVGYTKGVDAVGIWVRTAVDLTSLSLTAIDTDPSTSNGMGGYTGPDNNYFLGMGVIALTQPPVMVPALSDPALGVLALLLVLAAIAVLRLPRP